jgi:hypothetical protein
MKLRRGTHTATAAPKVPRGMEAWSNVPHRSTAAGSTIRESHMRTEAPFRNVASLQETCIPISSPWEVTPGTTVLGALSVAGWSLGALYLGESAAGAINTVLGALNPNIPIIQKYSLQETLAGGIAGIAPPGILMGIKIWQANRRQQDA